MHAGSIVVPEAKPAFEWVRGRALQKVSPSWRHGKLQYALSHRLTEWAGDRGEVASEWRFYVTPPGEGPRPLVPDVAYLSGAKFDALPEASREYPPLAPDIVVEILSPDDRAADVDHKRDVYLAAGTALVLIVDPLRRTMRAFERDAPPRFLDATAVFRATAFPDLTLDLASLFAKLDRPASR